MAQVFSMHMTAKAKEWKVTDGEISTSVWKAGYVKKKDGHPGEASISKHDTDSHWYKCTRENG